MEKYSILSYLAEVHCTHQKNEHSIKPSIKISTFPQYCMFGWNPCELRDILEILDCFWKNSNLFFNLRSAATLASYLATPSWMLRLPCLFSWRRWRRGRCPFFPLIFKNFKSSMSRYSRIILNCLQWSSSLLCSHHEVDSALALANILVLFKCHSF